MNIKTYSDSLKNFEILSKAAIFLSINTFNRSVRTWREEYGSYIFGKICLHILAIQKLLPGSQFFSKIDDKEVWDLPSICALTRTLIETYNVFYYLIIDDVKKDELEFRKIIWDIHGECERIEMLKLIGSEDPQIKKIENYIKKKKVELKNNKFYEKLNPKSQKDYIKGKKGIFLTNSKISKNAGINPNYYKAVYKYLSNYVHTYPFSITQIPLFRAGELKSLEIIKVAVDYSIHYLCLAIRDFLKIFSDQKVYISKEIFRMIDDAEYMVSFKR